MLYPDDMDQKVCAERTGAAASVVHRRCERLALLGRGEACERQAGPLSACIHTRAYGENIGYQRYTTQARTDDVRFGVAAHASATSAVS